jgi:hypothetical protein
MGRRPDPSWRALGACSLAVVVLLVTAASAMGQAAIDQYVPSTKPGGHHGDPADAIREATGTSGPGSPAAQARAKKKAPVAVGSPGAGPPSDTDSGSYPLTTFVIVILLLFLIGLAARYLPDLIRRLRLRLAS